MASCLRVRLSNARCLCRFYSSRSNQNGWQDENSRKWNSNIVALSASSLLMVSCGTALWLNYRKHGGTLFTSVHAAASPTSNKNRRKENAANPLGSSSLSRLSSRERRFVQFASTEYGGQLYMTPQDFLESVIEAEPRPRLKRRILQENNLTDVQKTTPSLSKGSPRLFRDLRDQGILSYTEYLFLLSILTKPKSGFRIAFNMFDTDGNARVDKQEFMVLLGVLCRKIYKEDELKGLDPQILERIFSHAYRDRRGFLRPKSSDGDVGEDEKELQESATTKKIKYRDQEALNDLDEGLQRRHEIDTTLLVHLFGKSGTRELTYEQFSAFMENLQTEVLEMEFLEFSKGLATITELDFAKILLRYTQLDPDTYDEYLDRLLESDAEEKGITFQEFLAFCTFLNNLEDFAVAMRMYSLADRPISEDEFQRAVKICTGSSLSPHVVRTVFLLFDEDGDGRLSDREFVAIMRDRIHRGLKSYTRNEGWDAFKHCVKQEMKSAI